jgi:large subunit ribosomal protein LP0
VSTLTLLFTRSQIALATEITFEGAEKAKAYLENPEAFAVAAPVATEAAAAAPAKVEEKEEEKEESDDDMG